MTCSVKETKSLSINLPITVVRLALVLWKSSNFSLCISAANLDSSALRCCSSHSAGPSQSSPWSLMRAPPSLDAYRAIPCDFMGAVDFLFICRFFSRAASARFRFASAMSSNCCSLDNTGVPQNVQGPGPSLTHIILPHIRQLGLMDKSSCLVARYWLIFDDPLYDANNWAYW